MLVFRTIPELSWALLLENVTDCTIASAGLIVLAPLLATIVLAVRARPAGPVILCQRRSGIHGKPFTMLKFRTMSIDAESHRSGLLGQNEMRGPVFKIDRDPRLTPVGRWLRRASLDELLQLVNVFLGDMSLVGPRPLPLYEVEKFTKAAYRRQLSMKPGPTCLWQIRGRNNVTSFDDWVPHGPRICRSLVSLFGSANSPQNDSRGTGGRPSKINGFATHMNRSHCRVRNTF
jgi:lipopolysaccharide/colanic/teichoic acid biosynthesis glycosyltransferase